MHAHTPGRPDGGAPSLRWTSWRRTSAATHLAVSAGIGILVGAAVGLAGAPPNGFLTAWIVAATVFLGWTWTAIWPLDAGDTALVAGREDPSRPARDVLLVVIALSSVLTVSVVIFRAHDSGPVLLVLGIAAIVAAWAVLHTIFILTYARLYYSDPVGGVDFSQDDDPTYQDFAYVGFTVGMTFQVSDTDIGKRSIRSTILRHALLSFVFGAVILAVTVNLLAGLGG
jgi:uncharacterized membrane protein